MILAPAILALSGLLAQDAADAAKLKAAQDAANKCAEATVKGDFAMLASLTHPAVVKAAGGREEMIKKITAAMEEMKGKGFKFDETKVEPATKLVKSGSSLYCVLPTTNKMSFQAKTITLKTFLLGVSTDDGKTWTFLDGNGGEAGLRKIVPEIPKDLAFPARQDPKIE